MITSIRNRALALPPHRQSGAALVVGLILLMVLTLLAISGMNTATIELQMAGNAQYSENAFQAAEAGIDAAVATGLTDTSKTIEVPVTDVGPADAGQMEKYSYSIRPVPEEEGGIVTGVVEGMSSNVFAQYHFEITSEGTSSRGATSTHTQNFYVHANY